MLKLNRTYACTVFTAWQEHDKHMYAICHWLFRVTHSSLEKEEERTQERRQLFCPRHNFSGGAILNFLLRIYFSIVVKDTTFACFKRSLHLIFFSYLEAPRTKTTFQINSKWCLGWKYSTHTLLVILCA